MLQLRRLQPLMRLLPLRLVVAGSGHNLQIVTGDAEDVETFISGHSFIICVRITDDSSGSHGA